MDILAIAPQTITVNLKHPSTGLPTGIKIEVQSMESDEVKSIDRAIRNKALRSGRNSVTAERIDDNAYVMLAATIVSWVWPEGFELGDIPNPPCTQENKMKVVRVPWMAKQIDEVHGDQSAFFTTSGNSTAS